MKARP